VKRKGGGAEEKREALAKSNRNPRCWGRQRREPGGSKHHYSMLLPLLGAWFLNDKALVLLNAAAVHLAHEVLDQMPVP
jgi:hypothetical protein